MSDPWGDLDRPSRADRLALRRVSGSHPLDLYWGKDNHCGYWLCYYAQLTAPGDLRLPQLGGIEVALRENQEDEAAGWELSLGLENAEHRDLFRALCADLVHATESLDPKADDTGATILVQRLWRWQSLLKRRWSAVLSYNQRLGLLGEILVLRECLSPRLGVCDAVRAWRGPAGAEQDFLLRGGLLEVKSQLATDDRTVRISSAGQLDESSGRIWLCHQRFAADSATAQSAETLNEAVAEVRAELENGDPLAAEVFEARLLEAGYVTRDEYDADSWTMTSRTIYEVGGEFPRIKTGNLRAGIDEVTYSISLSGCEAYRISEDQCFGYAAEIDG